MAHHSVFDDLASLDPLQPTSNASGNVNPRADDMDKLGPLFSPSTPRASPEAPVASLPSVYRSSSVRQASHQHHRAPSTSSQSSDFGAFVSVSAFDDPLAGDPIADDFEPFAVEVQEEEVVQAPSRSRSRSTTRASGNTNPTLNFFDQFASDARDRSSATRNLVLDELLLHQDDPMYFLETGPDKNLPETPATSTTITQHQTPLAATLAPLSPPPPLPPPKSPRHASKPGTPQPPPSPVPKLPPPPEAMTSATSHSSIKTIAAPVGSDPAPVLTPNYMDLAFDLHQDVDHSYFSIPPTEPPPPSADDNEHIIDLTPNRIGRAHTLHPRRSSSLLVPEPRLAAPVTSPEGALRSLDESPEISSVLPDDLFTTSPPTVGSPPSGDTSHPQATGMTRSPSSTSLSTSLSSLPGAKWMSTLLRGTPSSEVQQQHQHYTQARPALESIFSHDEQVQAHRHGHSPHAHSVSPGRHERSDSEFGDHHPHSQAHQGVVWRQSYAPQHSQTMPTQPVTFSHGSAFAPKPPTPGNSFNAPNYLGTMGVGGVTVGSGVGSSVMSVTSTASPFASHTYVPPSGAPGFMGEGYGWDKGFSDELEAERRREKEASSRASSGAPPSRSTSAASGSSQGRNALPEPPLLGSGSSLGRHTPPSEMMNSLSVDATLNRKRDMNSGVKSMSDSGAYSRVTKTKGTDGGWGSTLFGFGTTRSKPATPPLRSSASPAHNPRGVSVSEIDPRGYAASRISPGADHSTGMGDFIERRAGNVELVGRKASSSPVLTSELAGQIRSHLPALSRLPKKWTLIYSLDQDGISLNTLYTRSEAHATRRPAPGEVAANNAAMLLVVKDADGAIFGAWLAEGIRYIKGGKGYYGGGESFLWKYTNDTLKVFKATGKNKYIALCEPDYISCGGGDGHYGFYLDSSLFDGSSAPCPTFDNEPLCSPGLKKGVSVTFECVGLEVWGMGS